MRVLAADIGGTKTIIEVAEIVDGQHKILLEHSYPSKIYHDFTEMLSEFLLLVKNEVNLPIQAACLGVAGPVRAGRAQVTNLPWFIDSNEIAALCELNYVHLINDFQAVGYGIDGLPDSTFVTLQQGRPRPRGERVIIGAGTGLGEGVSVWSDTGYNVLPSEGGHVDFAPVDALQIELLQYLMARMDRVTYERVISGPGLVRIHEFLAQKYHEMVDIDLIEAMSRGDPSAAITDFALRGGCPIAEQALDVFVRIYGAQAGNLALTCLPTGGLFIAGGIAPKIINKLSDGTFLKAFTAKAPMTELLQAIPIKVVMEPKVGLIGAAFAAARRPGVDPVGMTA